MAGLDRKATKFTVLTPNQVVAYNLRELRQQKKWTHEEAALRLLPCLGVKWSKASFSAAELSVEGKRIKQFSLDEIVALSVAFNVPIWRFFAPPTNAVHGRPVRIRVSVALPSLSEMDPGDYIALTMRQTVPQGDSLYLRYRSVIFEAILHFLIREYGSKTGFGLDAVRLREQIAEDFNEIIAKLGAVQAANVRRVTQDILLSLEKLRVRNYKSRTRRQRLKAT
jgi:hypothetical protein